MNTADKPARHEIAEWQHTSGGLVLLLDGRPAAVPHQLARMLLEGDRPLNDSPADDLLALESTLRHMAAVFGAEVRAAHRTVAAARAEAPAVGTMSRGRRSGGAFDLAARHHGDTSHRHHTTLRLVDDLRRWVRSVNPAAPLLAEAVEGWARGPQAPFSVITFADTDGFLAADPRRVAERDWGGLGIDGVEAWGHGWRRDGDDDDPASFAPDGPDRGGYWSLGFCARTGEIYAVRRSPQAGHEVWLLGDLVRTRELADAILHPLQDFMRQPNSVVLAAQVVGRAVQEQAA